MEGVGRVSNRKDLTLFSQAMALEGGATQKEVLTDVISKGKGEEESTCRALETLELATSFHCTLFSRITAEGGATASLRRGGVFSWPWVWSAASYLQMVSRASRVRLMSLI